MDLRIVIVPWNVEKLLERCLSSLPAACEGLDWEVVAVDNASKDASVAAALAFRDALDNGSTKIRIRDENTNVRMTVVANPDNRGFARACNQGIAGLDARYVLLLNPDTECPPGSLTALVKVADARPEAGIVGPKLTYPDGRYQQSVRGFPTVWSQAGILLKLHHLVPWLPTFRRYFRDDLAADEPAQKESEQAEQVMGACFLIRREVIEQIGGLDERYFIWFEEVDYCRMAREKGWPTLYAPSVSIIHHGGQSFDQVFSVKKQQMFSESMVKYFAKWQPGWRGAVLKTLRPPSIWLSWLVQKLKMMSSPRDSTSAAGKRGSADGGMDSHLRGNDGKTWLAWLVAIVVLEAISLITYAAPLPRTIAAVIAALIILAVSVRRPDIGLAALLAELAIGSKGALLKIGLSADPNAGVPLRMAFFAAFFAGWGINWVTNYKSSLRILRITNVKGRLPWLALAALCVWAFARGRWLGNGPVLQDANAWGYLLLLIPVVDVARRSGASLIRHATQALYVALIWLPVKTLAVLYAFSHGIQPLSDWLYYWFRRTGVGEPTLISGNLFRMFLQSQIYAAGAVVFGAAVFCHPRESGDLCKIKIDSRLRGNDIVVVLSLVSILISLSRSLWIGVVAGGLILLVLWMRSSESEEVSHAGAGLRPARTYGAIVHSIASVIIAIGLIAGVIFFPFPRVDVGSLATLFASRGSVSDAASKSRWELLPAMWGKIKQAPILGSGFGATVTYTSFDPRVRSANARGTYTTYAFEWGWVDHWLKFGILGIPVMLWLVASLCRRIWRTEADWSTRAGLVAALIALSATHFFTPYLNHPLGFGILLAAESWITARRSVTATQ